VATSAGALQLYAQTVGDPVDKGEIADDRARIVDGAIVVSLGPQRVNVSTRDRVRSEGEHVGIRQQRVLARMQVWGRNRGCLQATHDGILIRRREAFVREDGTETRPVMVHSIATMIQRRYAHAQQLALSPRQRAGTVHQLLVELVMLAHD
jgi:hypothetical protein